MNIDNFISSELRVVASESVDISQDLDSKQTKNISELLSNEEKKTDKQKNQESENDSNKK